MNNQRKENRKHKNIELRRNIDKLLDFGDSFIKENLGKLGISNYKYDISIAVNELSLDEDLIRQLIEDYIIQILKSKIIFYEYIEELKQAEFNNIDLDYQKIRDLAHKNLGVVKNLRVNDAKTILEELMKEEDPDYLKLCVKALEISAVKLNPLCAYETLNLIQVKNSL